MNMPVSTDDDYEENKKDKESNITKMCTTTINGIRAITFKCKVYNTTISLGTLQHVGNEFIPLQHVGN